MNRGAHAGANRITFRGNGKLHRGRGRRGGRDRFLRLGQTVAAPAATAFEQEPLLRDEPLEASLQRTMGQLVRQRSGDLAHGGTRGEMAHDFHEIIEVFSGNLFWQDLRVDLKRATKLPLCGAFNGNAPQQSAYVAHFSR